MGAYRYTYRHTSAHIRTRTGISLTATKCYLKNYLKKGRSNTPQMVVKWETKSAVKCTFRFARKMQWSDEWSDKWSDKIVKKIPLKKGG